MDTICTDRQLVKMLDTMRDKEMTPERLTLLIASGIFAAVCDPQANLANKSAVQIALGLRTSEERLESFTDWLLAPPDMDAVTETFLAIEKIVGKPLLELASDPAALMAALKSLDFGPFEGVLNRAHIAAEDVDSDVPAEIHRYLLALHVACKFWGVPLNAMAFGKKPMHLIPEFKGKPKDEDTALRRWIIKQQAVHRLTNEHVQALFAELGLLVFN